MSNVLRRSAGFYSRSQRPRQFQQLQQQQQRRPRQKRQSWMNNQQNGTNNMNRPGVPRQDLGPSYFQPQQQVYGGYPAAPSPFGTNNQLYNPGYVMNGYTSPNSEYFPSYNGTYLGGQNFNYNNLGVPNQPVSNTPWNTLSNGPINPQFNSGPNNSAPTYHSAAGGYIGGSTYSSGPQSCMAMSGERITVQTLAGTQPEGMKKFFP